MHHNCNQNILLYTKDELNYLVSCLLHLSAKDASKFVDRFGKAIVAKITATGATTGVMGLVASLATANTGTALVGLHGAAASSATLAWIGGIFGGGVVAGQIITGGLGLIVGVGTYRLLSSKARDYAQLSEKERYCVDSCTILIKYINEWLEKKEPIEISALHAFAKNALEPFVEEVSKAALELEKNLDVKNTILFRAQATHGLQRLLNEYTKLTPSKDSGDA